ncbi:helix-turn-helix domain-containing protein [Kitasatospora sp. NPDC059646]|uniref:helix-turn-helix domain-containing protein n=1 Tax=Kitasatospora sp. NPDC059646 TaxID=3346893 RepID=UPI0036CB3AE8
MVLGPAVAPAGQTEPHPFARVLTDLMAERGIPYRDTATGAGLSMATIRMLQAGRLNPSPLLVRPIAEVLGMSEADVAIIAGVGGGGAR